MTNSNLFFFPLFPPSYFANKPLDDDDPLGNDPLMIFKSLDYVNELKINSVVGGVGAAARGRVGGAEVERGGR